MRLSSAWSCDQPNMLHKMTTLSVEPQVTVSALFAYFRGKDNRDETKQNKNN